MSDATSEAAGADVAPLAADRPSVDGTRASSEELRAEADAHVDDRHVDQLRAEVADNLTELTARLDAQVRTGRTAALRVLAGAAATTLLLLLVRRRRAGQQRNRKMP